MRRGWGKEGLGVSLTCKARPGDRCDSALVLLPMVVGHTSVSSSLSRMPVYILSPSTGVPAQASCPLSWCVRPVRGCT
jgi:hypothetical protein